MSDRATLADGTRAGTPLVPPGALARVLATESLDPCAQAGLWRACCGLTQAEIAQRLGKSQPVVYRLLRDFAQRLRADPLFAQRVAELFVRIKGV